MGGVRLLGIPRESWLRRKTIKSEAARRARVVTDNRTNEPTEAQVEAACVAYESTNAFGPERATRMRAALVAAQGAAPQAEAYDHCCQHPKCPGGSLCCCVSERRLRDCWNQWREEIAGDSRQAFRDGYQAGQNDPAPWLAAQVLPSSGVDEDALAEVIEGVINETVDMPLSTRLVLVRAVVEVIGGEGR